MPWRETNVQEQRIAFVIAAQRPGANRRALCREFGISPPTGYKWLARTEAEGVCAGVTDRSRRPRHSPARIDPAIERQVIAARHTYGWAGRKLRRVLAADGATCSVATIDRIIRRHGLTDPDARQRPAPQRFEAAAPNVLWQMDFKGQYPVREGWGFPLSVLDDHSRYAVTLAALSGTAAVGVEQVLTRCFAVYGIPDAMLVDHGVPWWSPTNAHGLTRLTVFLLEQDIRLIYSGFGHPQTQGKVERFHRTLGRRLRQWGVPTTRHALGRALARFRHEYNTLRPHEALADDTPASCYQPSARPYVSRPAPWPYPPEHQVLRVNANGAIRYHRRLFYVSDALAHREVGCQPIGDRVLVAFRGTYVRELDLRTGRTSRALTPIRPGC